MYYYFRPMNGDVSDQTFFCTLYGRNWRFSSYGDNLQPAKAITSGHVNTPYLQCRKNMFMDIPEINCDEN